jgi:hypothetical protein
MGCLPGARRRRKVCGESAVPPLPPAVDFKHLVFKLSAHFGFKLQLLPTQSKPNAGHLGLRVLRVLVESGTLGTLSL